MQSERRKPRRTANACVACRQSKIKCSGEEPCANCRRRFVKCYFSEASNRVTVSERYLRELRNAANQQASHTPRQSSEVPFGSLDASSESDRISSEPGSFAPVHSTPTPQQPDEESGHALNIWTNPFSRPSTIIKNIHQNRRSWIWLAPSSTWSFTARLTVMMTQKLQLEMPPNALTSSDGIYSVQWKPYPVDEPPDITGLPPVDYALYLFDTVKFHLGQKYRFFDEESLVKQIKDFYYGGAAEKIACSRLWFVQFLLVLAFGKAFLSHKKGSKDPPGVNYFVRAMSLMPDHATLWRESLLAIEVLALAGLYLYSIGQRESSHVHVGQAIRIAQLEGLHTELPETELGAQTVTRCRNLWWTLYILDRHFSSSLGLPMTTQDSDITTVIDPPNMSSPQDTSLSLQVRLSHLSSLILTGVYKAEKTSLGNFLETTRSILHTLAGHAQEIEQIFNLKFQNSVDTLPMGTRHITLLYHQCVIIATRPLLLSVLKERLEDPDQSAEDWRTFFTHTTTTLISTGIKSAIKTLQILADGEGLLEVFLPFDLEFTYGAAIHLTMANALFPRLAEGQDSTEGAYELLDEMINKGNRVAEARRNELLNLKRLFAELSTRIEERGLRTLTLPDMSFVDLHHGDAQFPATPFTGSEAMSSSIAVTHPPLDADQQVPCNTDFLDNIGISSYEFLSIVDQMGHPDLSYSMLDAGQDLVETGDSMGSFT